MTMGLIDSACVTSVIDCLRCDSLERSSSWAYRAAVEATAILLSKPFFGLAPSPEGARESVGDFAAIQQSLGLRIHGPFPREDIRKDATSRASRWCRDNRSRLQRSFATIYQTPDFQLWLDHEISFIWKNHSASQNGLFNTALFPQLARLLDIDQAALSELRQLSAASKELSNLIRIRPSTSDFDSLCRAYTGAFFLRSAYHDYIADLSDLTIMPHRLRREGFLPNRTIAPFRLEECPTTARLADLILRSARKEHANDRAGAYVTYVRTARERYDDLDLSPKATRAAGENATIDAAKAIGLHTRGPWLYHAFDAGLALLGAGVTSFLFEPFWAFAAGVSIWGLSKKGFVGPRRAEKLDTRHRLKGMMKKSHGRLGGSWD